MAKPQVRIRMYRKLLGDCFLITIGNPKAQRDKRSHILIDCGVLQQVPGEVQLMKDVAADIRKTVGDYVDLMVITHEHWDHISGFAHARNDLIDTLNIRQLWLAWTEKRGDPQADILRGTSDTAKTVVATAAGAAGDGNPTGSLEDFNGPVKKGKLSSTEIIPALIDRATKTGAVEYLEPGTVTQTPGPVGLRANILAPPRDPDKLTKDLPTPGPSKETYIFKPREFAASVANRYALAGAMATAFENTGYGPFGRTYRRSIDEVQSGEDSTERWLRGRYFASRDEWRKIDNDWLDAAGALALKLDSDTNNTSLVLALELETGGDVLLFAADAQVGNWLSWHDQQYPTPAQPGVTSVPARDLLRRTVFYKVGHHASHNATLKDLGLELMTHPELCAMIPVVEAEARRVKNGKAVHRGWDMPYPDLYTKLLAKTKKRLLRGDADAGKDPEGKIICNDQKFLNRVSGNALFHELRIQ